MKPYQFDAAKGVKKKQVPLPFQVGEEIFITTLKKNATVRFCGETEVFIFIYLFCFL